MLKLAILDTIKADKAMKIQKNYNLLIVCLLSLGFFLFTSIFIVLNQPEGGYFLWSSPDESANYYVSYNYSQTSEMAVFDKAGLISNGWTSPRSLKSELGFLKPVSFPGIMLIYGSLSSIFGVNSIPFLTPLFAALGIIFFFAFLRRIFSERVALISSFLLAFFPVYIYYSIRAMFHNVLFIVLLIFGLYLLSSLQLPKKIKNLDVKDRGLKLWGKFKEKLYHFIIIRKDINRNLSFVYSFFAGLFFGLALIVRTSEALWLLPLLFLMWIFYLKRFGLMKLVLFLSGLFTAYLPAAYYNQLLYGSAFYGGYSELNSSIDEISQVGTAIVSGSALFKLQEIIKKVEELVFYFGFKPGQSWKMFEGYVIKMFPILFFTGLFGFITLSYQNIVKSKKKQILFLIGGLLISIFLVLYYGSWKFHDNPDISRMTIGNSYTRYWLPLYLWLMPIASWFVLRFSVALFSMGKMKNNIRKLLRLFIQILFISVYVVTSLFFVLFGSEEGLVYWRYNNIGDKSAAQVALNNTEEDAVIISRYNDKYFFPSRKVIVATLPDNDLSPVISKLVNYYPVYYFHFRLKDEDIKYLNERRLIDHNLEIRPVIMTGLNTYLYKIERKELIEIIDNIE